MSIIQEALKKVRGMPDDEMTGGVDTYRYETSGYSYREKRRDWSVLFLVIIVIAAASFYFFKNVFPDAKQAVAGPVTAVPAPQAPTPAGTEEKDQPPLQIGESAPVNKTADTSFILSGIMFLEDGPRAIINGSVFEEGDTLEGASIEKIEREKVLLRSTNEKIVLNLK